MQCHNCEHGRHGVCSCVICESLYYFHTKHHKPPLARRVRTAVPPGPDQPHVACERKLGSALTQAEAVRGGGPERCNFSNGSEQKYCVYVYEETAQMEPTVNRT